MGPADRRAARLYRGLALHLVALLAGKAASLAAAGLRRVTVSLDSLDDKVFMALNDTSFPVARVLEAIAAAAAWLGPVKVNMVVRRGGNE